MGNRRGSLSLGESRSPRISSYGRSCLVMALNSSAGLPSGSKCDPGKQATGKCVTGEAETSQVIMVIRHGERLDNLDHMWIHRAVRPYDHPSQKKA